MADGGNNFVVRSSYFIILYVILQTIILWVVRALGFFAIFTSTVIVFGGFVTDLETKDFKYVALISLLQSARVFNALVDEEYRSFVGFLIHSVHKTIKSIWTRQLPSFSINRLAYTILMAILTLVPLHPVFVFYFNIGTSLEHLKLPDYGLEGKAYNDNLKLAIKAFYCLAFFQGVLYLILYILDLVNFIVAWYVAKNCMFNFDRATESISRYISDTKFKCMKNVSTISQTNLITYASSLLDSDNKGDCYLGARMLVIFKEKHKIPVQDQILTSRNRFEKLIMMLAWKDPNEWEVRLDAGKIVEYAASDIILAQFPGTLGCVASLLVPFEKNVLLYCSLNPVSQEDGVEVKHHLGDNKEAENSIREFNLIKQGFNILESFTHSIQNCLEICKDEALVTNVLSWICSKPTLNKDKDPVEWVEILKLSFKVLTQLASRRGGPADDLRKKAVLDMNPSCISNYRSYPAIQIAAINAFSQVNYGSILDKNSEMRKKDFLGIILDIFIPREKKPENNELVQETAGNALSLLSLYRINCVAIHELRKDILHELLQIIDSDTAMNFRAIAADIYKRLYSHLGKSDEEVLQKVRQLLENTSKTNTNTEEGKDSYKRLQAALLHIIYIIFNKGQLNKEGNLKDVLTSGSFDELLKKLIEKNENVPEPYSLAILMYSGALVRTLIDHYKGLIADGFNTKKLKDSLSRASNCQHNVDSFRAFRRNQERGATWDTSLAEIVEDINASLSKNATVSGDDNANK